MNVGSDFRADMQGSFLPVNNIQSGVMKALNEFSSTPIPCVVQEKLSFLLDSALGPLDPSSRSQPCWMDECRRRTVADQVSEDLYRLLRPQGPVFQSLLSCMREDNNGLLAHDVPHVEIARTSTRFPPPSTSSHGPGGLSSLSWFSPGKAAPSQRASEASQLSPLPQTYLRTDSLTVERVLVSCEVLAQLLGKSFKTTSFLRRYRRADQLNFSVRDDMMELTIMEYFFIHLLSYARKGGEGSRSASSSTQQEVRSALERVGGLSSGATYLAPSYGGAYGTYNSMSRPGQHAFSGKSGTSSYAYGHSQRRSDLYVDLVGEYLEYLCPAELCKKRLPLFALALGSFLGLDSAMQDVRGVEPLPVVKTGVYTKILCVYTGFISGLCFVLPDPPVPVRAMSCRVALAFLMQGTALCDRQENYDLSTESLSTQLLWLCHTLSIVLAPQSIRNRPPSRTYLENFAIWYTVVFGVFIQRFAIDLCRTSPDKEGFKAILEASVRKASSSLQYLKYVFLSWLSVAYSRIIQLLTTCQTGDRPDGTLHVFGRQCDLQDSLKKQETQEIYARCKEKAMHMHIDFYNFEKLHRNKVLAAALSTLLQYCEECKVALQIGEAKASGQGSSNVAAFLRPLFPDELASSADDSSVKEFQRILQETCSVINQCFSGAPLYLGDDIEALSDEKLLYKRETLERQLFSDLVVERTGPLQRLTNKAKVEIMSGVSVATHVSSYALHVSPVNEGLVATAVDTAVVKVLLTLKKLVSLNAFMSLDTSMKGLLRSLLPSIRFFTQPTPDEVPLRPRLLSTDDHGVFIAVEVEDIWPMWWSTDMSPFDSAEPSVRKTLARWLYNNVSSAIPLFLWSLFTEQAKGRKVIIGQVLKVVWRQRLAIDGCKLENPLMLDDGSVAVEVSPRLPPSPLGGFVRAFHHSVPSDERAMSIPRSVVVISGRSMRFVSKEVEPKDTLVGKAGGVLAILREQNFEDYPDGTEETFVSAVTLTIAPGRLEVVEDLATVALRHRKTTDTAIELIIGPGSIGALESRLRSGLFERSGRVWRQHNLHVSPDNIKTAVRRYLLPADFLAVGVAPSRAVGISVVSSVLDRVSKMVVALLRIKGDNHEEYFLFTCGLSMHSAYRASLASCSSLFSEGSSVDMLPYYGSELASNGEGRELCLLYDDKALHLVTHHGESTAKVPLDGRVVEQTLERAETGTVLSLGLLRDFDLSPHKLRIRITDKGSLEVIGTEATEDTSTAVDRSVGAYRQIVRCEAARGRLSVAIDATEGIYKFSILQKNHYADVQTATSILPRQSKVERLGVFFVCFIFCFILYFLFRFLFR